MFGGTLDLAAQVDSAAAKARGGKSVPLWADWWWSHGRPVWPVQLLVTPTEPPDPRWRDGARWEWNQGAGSRMLDARSQVDMPMPDWQAVFSAAAYLVDVNWVDVSPDVLAFNAVYRVSAVTQLELDARLDDDLAEFPGTTASRGRSATESAQQKRAVAGDIQMTLDRMPDVWQSVVFNQAGIAGPRGKW